MEMAKGLIVEGDIKVTAGEDTSEKVVCLKRHQVFLGKKNYRAHNVAQCRVGA